MKLFFCLLVASVAAQDGLIAKRLRHIKDLRWTFDFDGLPNDPSVQIDSIMTTAEKKLHQSDLFNVHDNSDTSATNNDLHEKSLGDLLDSLNDLIGEDDKGSMTVLIDSMDSMSIAFTAPSAPPSLSIIPSLFPTIPMPSSSPSLSRLPTGSPRPTTSQEPSTNPSVSLMPSAAPVSTQPSTVPSMMPSAMTDYPTHSPTNPPTTPPTNSPTTPPTNSPTIPPTNSPTIPPTNSPTIPPTNSPTIPPTNSPTIPPTNVPIVSPIVLPTLAPVIPPTTAPNTLPTAPNVLPTAPVMAPATAPSTAPNVPPTSPTAAPINAPSVPRSDSPTDSPIPQTSAAPVSPMIPTTRPSLRLPSESPSIAPTTAKCNISPQLRSEMIFNILDTVADPVLLRNSTSPQGLAVNWLIGEDTLLLCPNDEKLIQRWALATMYYSTGGDGWFKCSANPAATDLCGQRVPFLNKQRFLAPVNECEWAGVKCNTQKCVTELVFELNNLAGTIATEIGLLKDLEVWGMERGNLTGIIPTEIGGLSNLVFIDLDFNKLSGPLSPELLSLRKLEQLDLNDNLLTGNINGIGSFPNMQFMQFNDNFFTGTIPAAIGAYSDLRAFTVQNTGILGTMPASVCNLRTSFNLTSLIANCKPRFVGGPRDVVCSCCTDCRISKASV